MLTYAGARLVLLGESPAGVSSIYARCDGARLVVEFAGECHEVSAYTVLKSDVYEGDGFVAFSLCGFFDLSGFVGGKMVRAEVLDPDGNVLLRQALGGVDIGRSFVALNLVIRALFSA